MQKEDQNHMETCAYCIHEAHERHQELLNKISEYVKENPGVDVLDVADEFDISLDMSAVCVNQLIDKGILTPDPNKNSKE